MRFPLLVLKKVREALGPGKLLEIVYSAEDPPGGYTLDDSVVFLRADAMLSRWEDKREVKNLMGKYANLIILNRDHEVYDMLWAKGRQDTVFGTNDGWYVGDGSVRGYYDARCWKNKKIVSLLRCRLAGKFQGKTEEDLYGIGVFRCLPISCPIIEVAGDGKTAKGLWVYQGSAAGLYPYGPASRWIWGYYAVDFIREKGAWKICRLLWIENLSGRCGTNWGRPEVIPPDLPEFAEIREFRSPAPDVPGPLWTPWSPERKAVAPPLPQPYANYAEAKPELAGIPLPVSAADAGESAPNTVDATSASEADLKLLERVLDEEEVRTLVNRRVYYTFSGKRREELADLWVRGEALRKRASFGKNWGWYKGRRSGAVPTWIPRS